MESNFIKRFARAYLILLLLIFASEIPSQNAQGQVYKYIDEKGTIHFTDNPKSPRYEPVNITPQFWASKESNKYHYPSCKWAQKVNPSNLIKFNNPEEALKAGYVPCKVCNPSMSSEARLKDSNRAHFSEKAISSFEKVYCMRVIDGDTIVVKIKGKEEKVRLIGVNTPEMDHPDPKVKTLANEAYLFTKKMVEGKDVKLEFDQQKNDKYGRLLAYVYLLDGTFLNAEIIKQGYGFAFTRYPFKFLDQFRGFEKESRENKRGLWK